MGDNATIGIDFWISIDTRLKPAVYNLREWAHLKIAMENHVIWIRGFSETELNSTKVLSLPSIKRYYSKNGNLYKYGNKLPTGPEPNQLWTPIERGLPLSLPKENFNYFGIEEKIDIKLIPCEIEFPVEASVIELNLLGNYMDTAPTIRFSNHLWTILDNHSAIVIGQPILPLSGKDYYLVHDILVPTGYQFENSNITRIVNKILPEKHNYHFFISNVNSISRIRKEHFCKLNKGSFKSTMINLKLSAKIL